ncbi:MAG: hypothetical protein IT178_09365 [Acidobacteria bacterium]|nr:hypothetical protein [Acidobacteriota bacterium]
MNNPDHQMPGRNAAEHAASAAADAFTDTTNYIREADWETMTADFEQVVRRNPAPSLLVAAALGFLLGRALSR